MTVTDDCKSVTDDSYSILTHTIQVTHTPLTKRFEPPVYKPDRLTKLSPKLDLVSNLSSRDLIVPKRSLLSGSLLFARIKTHRHPDPALLYPRH